MYHLAQVNIGRLLAPLDDPQIAEFVENLDPINALADAAPGFVWRLQGEGNDATSLRPFDDDMMIVNMSVWESIESLTAFAYTGAHRPIMQKRRQFFERFKSTYMCLWWIPAGHIPTVEEAKERLAHVDAHGETPFAFSFKKSFPAPDTEPASPSDAKQIAELATCGAAEE